MAIEWEQLEPILRPKMERLARHQLIAGMFIGASIAVVGGAIGALLGRLLP